MASRILKRPPTAPSFGAVSRLSMGSSSSPSSIRSMVTAGATPSRTQNIAAPMPTSTLDAPVGRVQSGGGRQAIAAAAAAPAAQEKKASESKYDDSHEAYIPPDEEPPEAVDPSEEDTEGSGDEGFSMLQGEGIPFATSHIAGGCLNTIGFACTQFGWEPVVSSVYLHAPATPRAIAVDFGVETQSPTLNNAMSMTYGMLARQSDVSAQRIAAGSLVRRARLGDQNAMAILAETSANAKAGNSVAQSALACIQEYIQANPAGVAFHGESNAATNTPKMWAHIWLANGPILSNDRIREFASSFGEDTPERQAFLQGLILFQDSDRLDVIGRRFDDLQRKIIDIGQMFGKARALQHVRSSKLRISDYYPMVGWELGE